MTDTTIDREAIIVACFHAFELLAAINYEARTFDGAESDWFLTNTAPNVLNMRVKLNSALIRAHELRAYLESLATLTSPLPRLDCYKESKLKLGAITMDLMDAMPSLGCIKLTLGYAPAVYSEAMLPRLASIENYLKDALNALKQLDNLDLASLEGKLDIQHDIITLTEEIAYFFPFLEASLIGYIQTKNGEYHYLAPVYVGYSA